MDELIGAYCAHIQAGGYSPRTIRSRRYVLRSADGALPHGLAVASISELERWLAPWSGWTLYTYFEGLAMFYGWAVRRRFLDWDPTTEMIRPKCPRSQPRPVEDGDVAQALALPYPWGLAVLLAVAAGLRCTEICELRRERVSALWLTVRRKGGKLATLPTHSRIWSAVQGLTPGLVIHKPDGTGYWPSYFGHQLGVHVARLGLHGITLQRFRHTFGTWLMLPADQGGAGADARTAQELLSHENLSSTQIYTLVTDRQRRLAIEALPIPASP